MLFFFLNEESRRVSHSFEPRLLVIVSYSKRVLGIQLMTQKQYGFLITELSL